jgi:hypothetical protein
MPRCQPGTGPAALGRGVTHGHAAHGTPTGDRYVHGFLGCPRYWQGLGRHWRRRQAGHRSRYRVPVTGLMISVLNRAAISLQVSRICPAGGTQQCRNTGAARRHWLSEASSVPRASELGAVLNLPCHSAWQEAICAALSPVDPDDHLLPVRGDRDLRADAAFRGPSEGGIPAPWTVRPGTPQPAGRVRGYMRWGENQSRAASDGYCGVFSRQWTRCLSCTSLRYR